MVEQEASKKKRPITVIDRRAELFLKKEWNRFGIKFILSSDQMAYRLKSLSIGNEEPSAFGNFRILKYFLKLFAHHQRKLLN